MAFNPILPCELCEVVTIVQAPDKLITELTIFDQEGNEITEMPKNGIVDVEVKTFGFEAGEKLTVDFSLSDEIKISLEGIVNKNDTVIIKSVDLNECFSASDADSPSAASTESNTNVPVDSFNGYFYNSDGEYLSHEGDSDKVFLAIKYDKQSKSVDNKTVVTFKYEEVTDLNITHSDFCYIAYVVKNESGQTDITELKCIAYTSHNRTIKAKKTWKKLLASTYSSVANKQEMSDDLTDNKSKLTRKALIAVLTNETDITDGAEYWDGTDFIAWGKDEQTPYNKKGQNKFKEWKFIEIPKSIYDTYLASSGTSVKYTDKENHEENNDSGTHEHITEKKKVKQIETEKKYIKYSIPETVFLDEANWTSGSFYYETGVNVTNGISATIASGKSIFWKPTSSRLTSQTIEK